MEALLLLYTESLLLFLHTECTYPTSTENEHLKGEAHGDFYDNKDGEATDTASDGVKMKIVIFGYTVE